MEICMYRQTVLNIQNERDYRDPDYEHREQERNSVWMQTNRWRLNCTNQCRYEQMVHCVNATTVLVPDDYTDMDTDVVYGNSESRSTMLDAQMKCCITSGMNGRSEVQQRGKDT